MMVTTTMRMRMRMLTPHWKNLEDWPFTQQIFNTLVCYITLVANERHNSKVSYGLPSPEGDRGNTGILVLWMAGFGFTDRRIWITKP
jgi:hypothetical protein